MKALYILMENLLQLEKEAMNLSRTCARKTGNISDLNFNFNFSLHCIYNCCDYMALMLLAGKTSKFYKFFLEDP